MHDSPKIDYGDAPEVYGPSDKEVVPGSTSENPEDSQAASRSNSQRRYSRACGCTSLTFGLSIVIVLLTAAVIALASLVGIQSRRAKFDATSQAPPANFDNSDLNCTSSPSAVTKTIYKPMFYDQNFEIACNIDTPYTPLQGLFVPNFADCMFACASYSHYIPAAFGKTSEDRNKTCAGVSFIPLWTNETKAKSGGAPGNCLLKPGPMSEADLTPIPPNIGTEIHSAFAVNVTFVGGRGSYKRGV